MNDIVQELRRVAAESENDFYRGWVAELLRRAADEIEQLNKRIVEQEVPF